MSGAGSFLTGLTQGYMGGAQIDHNKQMRDAAKNAGTAQAPKSSPRPRSVYQGGGIPDASFDPASIDAGIASGIYESADELGISPAHLATVISYETGGTFDPVKAGPTTQHGQHRGLIQFGEPQAKQHGVDWDNPIGSQLGRDGAVVRYLRNAGVTPGMELIDIYSAVNAGAPGRHNASDANNGGASGTVADKVRTQMAGHRTKADQLLAHYKPPAKTPPAGDGRKKYERGIEGLVARGQDLVDRFYSKKDS